MRAFRKDQFRMMGTLVPWLVSNQAALAVSKAAAREAQDVIDGLPAVQAKAGATAVQTRDVTQHRNAEKKTFQRRLFSLLGPLRLHATRTNAVDLLSLVTIGRTAFRALRPELQAAVGQKVLDAAQKQAAALADYGLDGAYLSDAQATADAFRQGLPDTQTLLDARRNANATYEEVHAAQMQQIKELDLAMAVFETLNPELYRGYKQARAVLDTGSRGEGNA